ncbi:MAG: hypothetical protein A2Z20_09580 [Bdellovibrionales bacterium RBG_16_40_8]|nr:MAG: hypothetical protein A2Z20_09580 [Bdellovibrionales bacterium RBG_16_40_8]
MSKLGKISYFICVISTVILITARLLMGGWIDYLYGPLVISVVSLIAAWVIDYKFYLEFFAMKTTKHGMNMGVLILLAFVLTAAVNYLGTRFDKTFDLTKEKINSLSEQSIDVVKNLNEDLQVLIFYKGKALKERAAEIKNDFRLYTAQSSKLKVNVMDANLDVEMAKKYLTNSEAFATIAEYKGRRAIIQSSLGPPDRPIYQERDITSTFVKITRDRPMTIYFLTGHGEKDIDQTSIEGIKTYAELLRNDGYQVAKLNLITDDKIPEATGSVIAIVGPKTALTDKELDKIREFAKNGGNLFVAADPGEKHNIALLTKSFGVEFRNNYVLNEVQGTDEGLVGAIGLDFDKSNPITAKLGTGGRSLVIFPLASELVKAPDAGADYTFTDLIKSHPLAYTANSPNEAVNNPDRKQRVLAITAKSDKFSGVFFGDSDFLSDVSLNRWMHLDLAMNSIAYLFDDAANITIHPKTLEATQLQLTQAKGMALVLAGISLPLCLIILGGFFWYRRRGL